MNTEDITEIADALWPDVGIVRDCYVILHPEGGMEEYVNMWLARHPSDRSKVERVINHRHIAHLLDNREGEVISSDLLRLAKIYRATLESRLRALFPTEIFEIVEFGVSEVENDPQALQVTFYKSRDT